MTMKNDVARAQIKKISEFHKNYEKDYLIDRVRNKDQYLKDPKEALFFILSYSFYQGRKDEISEKFENKAKEVLTEYEISSSVSKYISRKGIKGEGYEKKLKENIRYSELLKRLEKAEVNKKGDRLMVVSFINLIESSEEKNLLKILIRKIKENDMEGADRLLKSVWSIGPKIAALILRDTVYIYHLEKYLDKKVENYYFLQPIDTWVHQVSQKLGMINLEKCRHIKKKTGEEECNIYTDEAKDITNACWKLGVNPIHYNQGAWYLAANSLKVLLENLEKL